MDDLDALLDLEDAAGDDPWGGEEDEDEAPAPPAKRPATADPAAATDPKRARAGAAGGGGLNTGATPMEDAGEKGDDDPPTADEDDGDLLPPPPPPLPRRAAGDIEGDALPVTSASGDRVYCALGAPMSRGGGVAEVEGGGVPTVAGLLSSGRATLGRHAAAACLLSAPLEELQEEADRVALEAAIAVADAADAAEARAVAAAGAAPPTDAPPTPAAPDAAGVSAARRAGPSALWADRHAPLAYTDLLSDEVTNRAVLRWLGGWRETVFGSGSGNGGAGGDRQLAQAARFGGPPPPRSSSSGRPDTRPPQKILLLTGPPGLGKTTLAHIAAAHAGYRAMEVNASDERSAAALGARVRDAVEMGCVADRGAPGPASADGAPAPQPASTRPRPVCVIVDEVDGAAGGPEGRSAVAALLRIAQASGGGKKKGGGAAAAREEAAPGPTSDSDAEDGEDGGNPSPSTRRPAARRAKASSSHALPGGGGLKKTSLPRLARPIIAIANDAFAPALRPLRSAALILTVLPPPPDRLIGRLQAICEAEGVKVERRALARVVAAAGGDARAALHALQLLARKAGPGGTVTDSAAARARAGVKDARASAFEVWGALLQARPRGSGGGPRAMRPPPGARPGASDAAAAWDAVADFGDADLVLRGLHEALPIARLAEGRARRLADAAEALSEGDALLGRARKSSAAFSLLRFAPVSALAFRAAVAGPDRPRFIGWPMTASDAARAKEGNAATLKAWLARLAPGVRSGVTAATAALDLVPALLACAARPALRPLAPHLLTPTERAALAASVSSLAAYGLTYAPRAAGAGSEPPAIVFEARRAAAAAAAEEHGGWRGGGGFNAGDRHRSSDADGALVLAPPIDDLCAFPARKGADAKSRAGGGGSAPGGGAAAAPVAAPAGPPQPVRALIAQEVERELIRRREGVAATKAAAAGAGQEQQQPASTPQPTHAAAGGAKRASLPLTVAERAKEAADAMMTARPPKANARPSHWLDALQARAAGGGAKAAAARAAASAAAAMALDCSPGGEGKGPACTPGGRPIPRASFKFHEGYTNAVRRPVRGRDLL